jgi:hypothetical protein
MGAVTSHLEISACDTRGKQNKPSASFSEMLLSSTSPNSDTMHGILDPWTEVLPKAFSQPVPHVFGVD